MKRPPRKFDDLTVGEKRVSDWRTISEEEIVEFARKYDPQWFHADPEAARHSDFGGVIASGVQNFAVWRQLDHSINHDIDYVCGVGFDDYRMVGPMRPGDRVRVTSEILELTPSASGKPRGTAVVRCILENSRGEPIIDFKSMNLVHRRT